MLKASEVGINELVNEVLNNEMQMALIVSDTNSDNLLDVLARKTTYLDLQGIFGDDAYISCKLFPLLYKSGRAEEILAEKEADELVRSRNEAYHMLFGIWTSLGYNKRKAKSPFGCKAFKAYADEIGFLEADYMLLAV